MDFSKTHPSEAERYTWVIIDASSMLDVFWPGDRASQNTQRIAAMETAVAEFCDLVLGGKSNLPSPISNVLIVISEDCRYNVKGVAWNEFIHQDTMLMEAFAEHASGRCIVANTVSYDGSLHLIARVMQTIEGALLLTQNIDVFAFTGVIANLPRRVYASFDCLAPAGAHLHLTPRCGAGSARNNDMARYIRFLRGSRCSASGVAATEARVKPCDAFGVMRVLELADAFAEGKNTIAFMTTIPSDSRVVTLRSVQCRQCIISMLNLRFRPSVVSGGESKPTPLVCTLPFTDIHQRRRDGLESAWLCCMGYLDGIRNVLVAADGRPIDFDIRGQAGGADEDNDNESSIAWREMSNPLVPRGEESIEEVIDHLFDGLSWEGDPGTPLHSSGPTPRPSDAPHVADIAGDVRENDDEHAWFPARDMARCAISAQISMLSAHVSGAGWPRVGTSGLFQGVGFRNAVRVALETPPPWMRIVSAAAPHTFTCSVCGDDFSVPDHIMRVAHAPKTDRHHDGNEERDPPGGPDRDGFVLVSRHKRRPCQSAGADGGSRAPFGAPKCGMCRASPARALNPKRV